MPLEPLAIAAWRRLDLPGHDAARVVPDGNGWRLTGVAAFKGRSGPAALRYDVTCAPDWTTRVGRVRGFVGERDVDWRIERGAGGWTFNGRAVPGLDNCMDLDFGFTPATNFTHMRRIGLRVGEKADVPVAWIDADTGELVAAAELTEMAQTYVRHSGTTCAYESSTTGYGALLEFAPDGFVSHYPELWRAEP